MRGLKTTFDDCTHLCDKIHGDAQHFHSSLERLQCFNTMHHVHSDLGLVVVWEVWRGNKDTVADVDSVVSREDATVVEGQSHDGGSEGRDPGSNPEERLQQSHLWCDYQGDNGCDNGCETWNLKCKRKVKNQLRVL